jgi:hypothetical protein
LHLKDLEEAEIPIENQTQIKAFNNKDYFSDFGTDLDREPPTNRTGEKSKGSSKYGGS